MDIFPGHTQISRALREPAVAIGNFDGCHRGHQKLFETIRNLAHPRGGEAVALTFQPHPAKVLAPKLAPSLICTPERKLARMAAFGVDACVVEPFDRALADLSPEEFVERILVRAIGARDVCVGYDFTFGKSRAGDVGTLERLGGERGFRVAVVQPVTVEGVVCSSTKIREAVRAGEIERAALLLGRPPTVEGEVVRGAGRGRTIGVPTANLRPLSELLPATGVYAGAATLEGGRVFAAAINVGTNPTFTGEGAPLTVEAHLLDYPGGDLYGARVELALFRRLRGEQKFPNVEALVAQIHRDVDAARAEAAARDRKV